MKSKILVTLLTCLLFSFSLASGQSLSLESVDGTTGLGNLQTGVPVTFNIRVTSDASNHTGITNGFQVYSPDGAVWNSFVGDTLTSGLASGFDLVFSTNHFSDDGMGADTVGFGGAALFQSGIPANFSEVAYAITIGPIAESELGKTIVLDSSFYTPTGVWKWAGPEAFPTWDGPHTFTIGDVVSNTPPVLAEIGPQSVDEGGNLVINVSATDDDGDPLTITGLPVLTNASFVDNGDGTATYTFNPDFTQAGDYDVTFEVSDGSDVDNEVVTITVNDANQPPVLAAIADTTIEENQNVIINVSATDADGTTPILSTSTLPGTASFTDNGDGTGAFDWTPTFDDEGSYVVTFFASDGTDIDSQLVTITVSNVNQSPSLDFVSNQSVDEGVLLSFAITGTDPDGDFLLYGAFDTPSGMTVSDSGDVNFTPGFDQAGVYNVNFYVTDGPDTAFQVAAITVNDVNQAPALADVDPQFVTAGESLTFGVSAVDPDGTIPTLSAENLPGTASFDDNGDGTGSFMWSTEITDDGTFDVTFIATDGELTDTIIVSITVGEAPIILTATPDTLFFEFLTGDGFTDSSSISVTAINGDATVEAVEFSDWLDLGGYTPATAPVSIPVIASPSGLTAGAYTDTVHISAAEAVNTQTVYVVMTITDAPNNPPVVVAPVDSLFQTDECTPITVNFEATDADGDELFLNITNMVENMTFTDNGDGTGHLDFAPNFSQAGVYSHTFYVSDGLDTSLFDFTILVDECEPGTEGDTVTVATVAAVPGARVTVPVDFANICTLWGFETSLSFNSDFITLDSISYVDSRVTLMSNNDSYDNDSGFVILSSLWAEADRQEPGSGNLANLHFSLEVGIPAGFYPLDFYMEPFYDRDCGGGNESVRPFFIPGGIVVDTSGNYVCGYVVDPEGNPIPGATVELWDDFPGGASEMMQDASGSGVFSFADFTTIPFDLYAY
ncbi:MAG: tandem-95 repeat protein, partial [Calditrichaeota bacterium]